MGKLNALRVYNAGAMQFCPSNGTDWREYITPILEDRFGLVVINPTDKPKCHPIAIEDKNTHLKLAQLMEEGKYDEVKEMSSIRNMDLKFVDSSDFLIINLNLDHYSLGTAEELTWANRCKKPCLVRIEQGKKAAPYWLLWMIPHEFIFNTWEEVIEYLSKIDSGEDERHFKRWKFIDLAPQTMISLLKASNHDPKLKQILDDYYEERLDNGLDEWGL